MIEKAASGEARSDVRLSILAITQVSKFIQGGVTYEAHFIG